MGHSSTKIRRTTRPATKNPQQRHSKDLTSVSYIKNIRGSLLSQWVFHSHCDITDPLLAYIPRTRALLRTTYCARNHLLGKPIKGVKGEKKRKAFFLMENVQLT